MRRTFIGYQPTGNFCQFTSTGRSDCPRLRLNHDGFNALIILTFRCNVLVLAERFVVVCFGDLTRWWGFWCFVKKQSTDALNKFIETLSLCILRGNNRLKNNCTASPSWKNRLTERWNVGGSPKCWLGPGWVWLGQISTTWPPATCLLPAIPSPVPATGSFTGSHPPASVAENWRMPAKLRLVASAPPADASHRSQRMSSLFPACASVTLQRSASRIFLLGRLQKTIWRASGNYLDLFG